MVDFRGCNSRELSEMYQAFGLLCAGEKVRAALLMTGGEDADVHYTLRDILVTLARIAGIPVRFRLALVASSGAVERVHRAIQGDLRSLGCDTRVFRRERQAAEWLCGARKRPARAALGAAAVVS